MKKRVRYHTTKHRMNEEKAGIVGVDERVVMEIELIDVQNLGAWE